MTSESTARTSKSNSKSGTPKWSNSQLCAYRKSHLGQEAAGAYLLQIRCSGYLLRQRSRSTRSPRCELRTKESCRVGERELEHLSRSWNCGEDCYVQAARRS